MARRRLVIDVGRVSYIVGLLEEGADVVPVLPGVDFGTHTADATLVASTPTHVRYREPQPPTPEPPA